MQQKDWSTRAKLQQRGPGRLAWDTLLDTPIIGGNSGCSFSTLGFSRIASKKQTNNVAVPEKLKAKTDPHIRCDGIESSWTRFRCPHLKISWRQSTSFPILCQQKTVRVTSGVPPPLDWKARKTEPRLSQPLSLCGLLQHHQEPCS